MTEQKSIRRFKWGCYRKAGGLGNFPRGKGHQRWDLYIQVMWLSPIQKGRSGLGVFVAQGLSMAGRGGMRFYKVFKISRL